jgi:hypothetical protein
MYDCSSWPSDRFLPGRATFLCSQGGAPDLPRYQDHEGHHNLSHHQRKKAPWKTPRSICLVHAAFALFPGASRFKDIDGNSLLHNSMIVYGSGNGDGNRHNHNNLPFVLAGSGGGTLSPGRYLKLKPQPMSNLYLGMLDRMGVSGVERHGDSTGRIEGI